jgi:hypothetical protein
MFENIFDLTNVYFVETMIMFVINFIFLFLLIRGIYFRYSKKEMFLFAFFLMGLIVFFIGSLLNAMTLEFGMAIGLVAVFTILRLRTRQITIKDMSYIFATIGISVINSLRLIAFPLLGRIIINLIIILAAYILEQFLLRNKSDSYSIVYENIELLKPDRNQELLNDLSAITGKTIHRAKIESVDYKKKSAELVIYYKV